MHTRELVSAYSCIWVYHGEVLGVDFLMGYVGS